jgi:hypothetical protein
MLIAGAVTEDIGVTTEHQHLFRNATKIANARIGKAANRSGFRVSTM